VVRSQVREKWNLQIIPANGGEAVAVPFAEPPGRMVVIAIDRTGQESEPAAAFGEK
jgi:hypothetical protein